MLFSAWADYDRALADVSREDAVRQIGGGSSFAWTLAHVTHGIDSWINVRFQEMEPHPLISEPRFRMGGDGSANDWEAIQAAVLDVRERARVYLVSGAGSDLDLVVPYDGTFLPFREHGIQLRPAILQNATHHFFHLGEIVTKREWMGYDTHSFPGALVEALAKSTTGKARE